MRRHHPLWTILAAAILFVARPLRADSLTFSVLPPDISGSPGDTIGWGYSITNNSATDYLDITQVDAKVFTIGVADSFPFVFSFVDPLAPGGNETQGYDAIGVLGLFEVAIDPGANPGEVDSGLFGLYGAFCPPSDPTCAEKGDSSSTLLATAHYSATVTGPSGPAVPEPSTNLLLLAGLLATGFWNYRRKTRVWSSP